MRALLIGLLALPTMATQVVTVEYRDKPPYTYTEQGKPAGFLLTRTVDIFRRANLAVAFEEVPVKRIMADIQANQRPICSPGWYKLPEREVFARFSLPIHQDLPQVVLAAPHAVAAVRNHPTMKALFADSALTMGVVDGVSYGPELDAMIAALPKPAMRATVPPLQMAKMIAVGRADFMIIDQDDLSVIDQHHEVSALGIVKVDFPDPPQGLKRYLICSKQVEPAAMAKLDEAIRAMMPGLNP